ncbi:MAG: DNA polymerase III subunit delta [Bacteroidia bacterium]
MPADSLQDFQKITQELKARKFQPIYLLYGEEPYFIDEISNFIEEHALNEMEKAFNQTILYAKDVEIAQVLESARRFPMMASHQVIIVKEAQNWKKLDELDSYFEKPVPTTILVICIKGKKVDGRSKLYKLSKKYVSFEAKKLYEDNELPKWIIQQVHIKGFEISEHNALLIADFIGSDLSRIKNEIEKLIINKDRDKEIGQDEIENFIGVSKEFNTFELLSALATKNTKRVFYINHHMSDKKDFSIIPLLAMMNSYFAKALAFKQGGIKDSRSMMSTGMNPKQAKDYERLLVNYSQASIEKILGIVSEYDLKSKGVNQNAIGDVELMKELLFKIIEA